MPSSRGTLAVEADPRHRRCDNAGRLLGVFGGDHEFDFTGQLPTLRVPVLVVCGADDPGTPASENRRLAGLVPGGPLRGKSRNARHFPNVERPEEFNRIMMGWLETQRHAR